MQATRLAWALLLLAASTLAEVVQVLTPGPGPLYPIRRNQQWGYMDRSGKTVIKPQFDEVRFFHNGLAAVRVGKKYGFIDARGQTRIVAGFDFVGDFTGTLAPVRNGRVWGYIDRDGKVVVEPQFQGAGNMQEGMALVRSWDRLNCGNRGVFTKDDADEYWFMLGWVAADSYSCFPENQSSGFVNERGQVVVPPTFVSGADFSEGLAAVRVGSLEEGATGYIDRTGVMVIAPNFQTGLSFREGLAAVQQNGKWGYVDRKGTVALPAVYDYAEPFYEGKATVWINGEQHIIDRSGRSSPKPPVQRGPVYTNGIALEQRAPYWVYIDASGRVIARYDE